ncbi:hypothetical protein ACHAWX_002562 [Stephanocyclus meneghinianus]
MATAYLHVDVQVTVQYRYVVTYSGNATACPFVFIPPMTNVNKDTVIMVLVILLFIILLIVLAQLNCFLERRRDDRHRREIQNLKKLQNDSRQARPRSDNGGAGNGTQ